MLFSAIKMARNWLILFSVSLTIFIYSLYKNNFILYAVSYITLGLAQLALPSDMKIAKRFTSIVVGKLISLKYALIDLTKIIAVIMATIAFIIHVDYTTLFYLIYLLTVISLVFLKVPFERILLPAALFSAGIIGNYFVAVKGDPITIKVAIILLINSFTISSLLYLIKAYREAKGKTFLLTGQIASIGLIMVGLFPLIMLAISKEIYWMIISVIGAFITCSSAYYLALTFSGNLWTAQIYHGDLLNEAADILSRILQREKVVYDVKEPSSFLIAMRIAPPRYEFNILSPFKAKIVLRKWIHRARVRSIHMEVCEPGLIIEVKPGPKKADPYFKKIVAEFLERLNTSPLDWKT